MLGVLRAEGRAGRVPASHAELHALAARLADAGGRAHPRLALLAVAKGATEARRVEFARRARALARYDRAATLRGLVHGLESEKEHLATKVLADPRIVLSPAGRADIRAGRVDVRIYVVLRYLRIRFGGVTVSCLVSGHRMYARPGVVSAHIYGLAVDISALGRTPIVGHEQPGGVTERAVRSMLRLPAELMPQQIISLLGLGGPSFALPDHYNHIHVGF
jgi:hypothetical protein